MRSAIGQVQKERVFVMPPNKSLGSKTTSIDVIVIAIAGSRFNVRSIEPKVRPPAALIKNIIKAVFSNRTCRPQMPLADHARRIANLLQTFCNRHLAVKTIKRDAVALHAKPILILSDQQSGTGRDALRCCAVSRSHSCTCLCHRINVRRLNVCQNFLARQIGVSVVVRVNDHKIRFRRNCWRRKHNHSKQEQFAHKSNPDGGRDNRNNRQSTQRRKESVEILTYSLARFHLPKCRQENR